MSLILIMAQTDRRESVTQISLRETQMLKTESYKHCEGINYETEERMWQFREC